MQLFKCLLNQLRAWSDPSLKRIFRLPIGSEQSFLDFIRFLKFDECFIDNETKIVASPSNPVQSEQEIERFLTANNPAVQLTDNNRRCENVNGGWYCVFGTLNYSTGIHRLRLKLEKGTTDVLMGISSRFRLPTGPFFYNKPSTCGWFTHRHVITNGQGSSIGWPQVNENDILELTINCKEGSITLLNERSRAKNSIDVNIYQAPFPWCLLVIFRPIGSRLSLI